MRPKTKRKTRIILGEGYPWAYGIKDFKQIGLCKFPVGMMPKTLKFPKFLWRPSVKKYKLILEEV